jgi:hypothetical protein
MLANGIAIAHGWQQKGTPPVPLCFRYAILNNAFGTTVSFAGWTINGVDFELNYVAEFAAQGCTSNSPYTNSGVLFDPHEIIVWYMGDGTSDPSFTILNDLGDPVSLTWNSICQKTCYESSVPIPSSDPIIYMLDPMGPAFLSFVQPSSTFGSIDVSNPSTIAAVQSYYQQCCGVDATINVTTDDNGDYIVQILNIYVFIAPTWYNGTVGPIFFNEISC